MENWELQSRQVCISFYCCFNKLMQIQWFKIIYIYNLMLCIQEVLNSPNQGVTGSRGESSSLSFPDSRHFLYSQVCSPFPPSSSPATSHLSHPSFVIISPSDHSQEKFFCFKSSCNQTEPTEVIQDSLFKGQLISKSNSICHLNPFCHIRKHIHIY